MTLLRWLLLRLAVVVVVLSAGLIGADLAGVFDDDGPLAGSALLDEDGLLTRLGLAGDDRLVWKLPFMGPDGGKSPTPGSAATASAAAAEVFRDRWPQVPAMEPVDLGETTLIASVFPDDRALFSFETSDARIWAEGTRTADGRADNVERLVIDRERFRTTLEFDQQGRVERVEQLDRDGLGSAAIGVIYGDEFIDLMMFGAISSRAAIGALRLSFADYPELRDAAFSPSRQVPEAARSLPVAFEPGRSGAGRTPAQDARRFLDIALTILDSDGDELDADTLEGIAATFEVKGVAVSPATQLRSRNLVTGKLIHWTRTGALQLDDDSDIFEHTLDIFLPTTAEEAEEACVAVVDEVAEVALTLGLFKAILDIGKNVLGISGGPAGWAVMGLSAVSTIGGQLNVAGVPKLDDCYALGGASDDFFRDPLEVTVTITGSTREWDGDGEHPDVGLEARVVHTAGEIAEEEPVELEIRLPSGLVLEFDEPPEITVGEPVTITAVASGGTQFERQGGYIWSWPGHEDSFGGYLQIGAAAFRLSTSTSGPRATAVYRFDAPGTWELNLGVADAHRSKRTATLVVEVVEPEEELVDGTATPDQTATPGSATPVLGRVYGILCSGERGIVTMGGSDLEAVTSVEIDVFFGGAREPYPVVLSWSRHGAGFTVPYHLVDFPDEYPDAIDVVLRVPSDLGVRGVGIYVLTVNSGAETSQPFVAVGLSQEGRESPHQPEIDEYNSYCSLPQSPAELRQQVLLESQGLEFVVPGGD